MCIRDRINSEDMTILDIKNNEVVEFPSKKVLKVLEINETSLGLLNKDNLLIAGKETIKGLHLSELFQTNDVDNL